MKNFTVNIGGQSMTMPGPDDATQEQAQAEAERQWQAKQAADVNKDFTGPGRLAANFAQGAAELVGGPAQLLGAKPGPLYQRAEAEPTTTADKAARFAGAALPLAPLSGAALQKGGTSVISDMPDVAEFLATKGLPFAGKVVSRPARPVAAAAIPAVVGGVEGASAPADTPTQRAINTGVGAFTGGFGRALPGASSLDRLAGSAIGGALGHAIGGGESWLTTSLGALLGGRYGHEAHEVVGNLLRRFPPSVVARAVAQLGEPMARALADEYDYLSRGSNGETQNR